MANNVVFLGELASAPTGHLKLGYCYKNTTDGVLYVWSGTSWVNHESSSIPVVTVVASDSILSSGDYVCDGTNDQTEIANAIASLGAGGGKILLSDGTFNISDTISLTSETDIVIEGQGRSTILFTNAGFATNGAIFKLTGCTGVRITSLAIDGNKANVTPRTPHGIWLTNTCSKITIDNCYIHDTVWSAVYDAGGTYTTIRNCHFESNKASSGWALIEGVGAYGIVQDNILKDGDYACISAYRGNYVNIVGNTCIGSPRALIEITTYNYGHIEANNCIVNSNMTDAVIQVASQEVAVIGNSIKVPSSAVTGAVTAIKFTTWGCHAASNRIDFDNTNYAHVGISGASGDHCFTGNMIINKDEVDGSGGSIAIIAQNQNNVLTGNYVNGFGTGFDVSSSTYFSAAGNFFYNTSVPFLVSAASYGTISGNTMSASVNCIYSNSASPTLGLTIVGNVFNYCTHDTIYGSSFQNCTISDNYFSSDGKSSATTYNGILLRTESGTNYSKYNTVIGNTFSAGGFGNPSNYCIREASTNDGPNIFTGNVALGAATANLSTQHASTVTANNITT